LNATSSSWAKPWIHHTVAVVAAAFARWGRAKLPAASKLAEPLSTERLVRLFIRISFSVRADDLSFGSLRRPT
jgi:hypothetical protein